MLKDTLEDLDMNGVVGDWCFIQNDSTIAIRYGEDKFSGIVLLRISKEGSDIPPIWKWNGSKEFPTLTPSILVRENKNWNPGWHGFLTDGKLISV